MFRNTMKSRLLSGAAFAATASALAVGPAFAGGFAVREQSTVFLGSAYAGAAAGGAISSIFFNSAAAAQLPGLNSESSYTIVLPESELTVTSPVVPVASRGSGDIGIDAVVGSSYYTYQLNKDLWVGLGLNAPFGLSTKPENRSYFGNLLNNTSKLFTFNANPTLAYKISPGVTIGAGIQVEYAYGKFQFATANPAVVPTGAPNSVVRFRGDDVTVGATVGLLLEPTSTTAVGVGWRSGLSHELDGTLIGPIVLGGGGSALGSIDLPDIVTLSARQAISPQARLLATVEWSNWSVFNNLTVVSALPTVLGSTLTIPTNWDDGWFFSGGGEYDYSPNLTLRAGGAYEISPIRNASQRLTAIPDNDRVWANFGASYKWSEKVTVDFAYSHIFVEDGTFDRTTLTGTRIAGNAESSVDLIAMGFRSKW